VSISLLNTKTGFTTPWHCSVAQLADGEWISAPAEDFRKDDRLELINIDGRPSHFRERPLEKGTLGITETTASYLKPAKPLSTSEYLSKDSSSNTVKSGDYFVFSSGDETGDSTVITPKTNSPPNLKSKGLGILANDNSSSSVLPKQTQDAAAASYGERLIPQIMDSLAAADPERVVFSLATSRGDSLEFRHISARLFTKAVDKTAWWLQNQIGKSVTIQPMGYIGPRKLRELGLNLR
jgi:Pyoverdine/dityrosine biosynthesis protein